jgi:hypothetical protein
MNLTTVNVAIAVQLLVGAPLPGGSVRFELTKADINGALVLPKAVCVALPADGSATTAQLWPNTLGTQGSQTKVTVLDQAGVEQFSGLATVPNFNCNLHDIITSIAPSTVTDAQAAVNLARAWAVQDPATVDGVDYSAKHHALAAKADRQLADADAAATAADRIQTGQDVVAANAAQAQSSSNMLTATAQASLAQGYAASAGSVAQQDLSGVTGVALHRSPNAIVATTIYDASKDSEGGAWINKVDASYLYEALNGKWLGACASEAAARAVSGAATGDYFQLTTDGKFYKLNAGAGTTEVLRGNTARFPRMAAIVAETSRVVIYDLLSPGRPMWMVFQGGGANGSSALSWNAGNPTTCVAMREAVLAVGLNGNGIVTFDFAKDTTKIGGNQGENSNVKAIALRNAARTSNLRDGYAIASYSVNVVVMTTMPDAPVDPATGLQVPTIALATATGVSVIQNNGSVVSSSNTGSFTTCVITPYMLWTSGGSTGMYAMQPGKLGASFAFVVFASATAAPDFNRGTYAALVGAGRATVASRCAGLTRLSLMRANEATFGASLAAQITDTHNTGWMAGDIRRCLLADVSVGSVVGGQLVANGGPAFVNTSGWTAGNNATLSVVGGNLRVTNDASGTLNGYGTIGIATTPGRTYRLQGGFPGTGTLSGRFSVGTTPGASDLGNGIVSNSVPSNTFVATTATTYVSVTTFGPAANATADFSFVTADEPVYDRSYKNKPAAINGTLTRAQVGVGSQLVAYSGWSAANYVREAYSADLDFGTGAWRLAACVSGITAAASTIAERSFSSGPSITLGTDATGKITGTAFDGTTTRTVTSSVSYTGSGFLNAALEYSTSGSLALKVNGVQVAQTTGTPLLTLNNASAVFTVGNNFALTAAFPGSICLVKPTATVPSDDASLWMYQQEAAMFRDGAQVTLPDSGAVVDMDYDPQEDKWKVASAANESAFVGLVRVSSAPVSAGSISKIASKSGIKLIARSTTNPGVDVTVPAQNLMAELLRRGEEAARLARLQEMFDWTGGFTGNFSSGTNTILSASGLSLPAGATAKGAQVSHANLPAGTTITDIVGTTVYLSANATGTVVGAQIGFLDFILPTGMEWREGFTSGALKQEGSTKDYTRQFDGFRERARFAATPGATAFVRGNARRIAA